jgi:hypothetical protein
MAFDPTQAAEQAAKQFARTGELAARVKDLANGLLADLSQLADALGGQEVKVVAAGDVYWISQCRLDPGGEWQPDDAYYKPAQRPPATTGIGRKGRFHLCLQSLKLELLEEVDGKYWRYEILVDKIRRIEIIASSAEAAE